MSTTNFCSPLIIIGNCTESKCDLSKECTQVPHIIATCRKLMWGLYKDAAADKGILLSKGSKAILTYPKQSTGRIHRSKTDLLRPLHSERYRARRRHQTRCTWLRLRKSVTLRLPLFPEKEGERQKSEQREVSLQLPTISHGESALLRQPGASS